MGAIGGIYGITETNTKTFGKETKAMVKKVFPTATKARAYGKNKMNQFINFYDKKGKHLGYWTNEGKRKGIFRKF